jgi:hypothetical protein
MTWASLHDSSFVGADGAIAADQYQYMAWITDEARNFLASNLFQLEPNVHVFLHPMYVVSAGLWRLGVPVSIAYLAWKPVAVLGLFTGFAAYVRRLLPAAGWGRPSAIFLALFYSPPVLALWPIANLPGRHTLDAVALYTLEIMSAFNLNGYMETALALGLLALFFLGAERVIDDHPGSAKSRRVLVVVLTAAAGGAISWLHPWQGVVLLLVLTGTAAWGFSLHKVARLAPLAAIAVIPIGYYYWLSHTFPAWQAAQKVTTVPLPPGKAIAVALAPLIVLALIAARPPRLDTQERILVLWPLAALVSCYALPLPFAQHALEGATLPLSILAVRGASRLLRSLPGGSVVRVGAPLMGLALCSVPYAVLNATVYPELAAVQTYSIRSNELAALTYVAHQTPGGGILARPRLGMTIPALTGHQTWVGHPTWTPDYNSRAKLANDLFDGHLAAADATSAVLATGARFVVLDCASDARLVDQLAPLASRTTRFGCALLIEVSPQR